MPEKLAEYKINPRNFRKDSELEPKTIGVRLSGDEQIMLDAIQTRFNLNTSEFFRGCISSVFNSEIALNKNAEAPTPALKTKTKPNHKQK